MDLAKADRAVRSLKAADKPVEKPLGGGISVRVTSNGQKTLYLRVKINGRPQRLRLGVYPACTLKDASDRALALRAEIKEGRDPRLEERRQKAGSNTPVTVAEAVERFVGEHIKVKVRLDWAKEAERLLRADVLPKIGAYPLKQLTRADLAALIAKKAEAVRAKGGTGIAANRLSAVLSRFARFAADYGWLDPVVGFRLPKPAPETARERNLSAAEIGALWPHLLAVRRGQGPCPAVYGHILSLVLLTGWRVTEVTKLTPALIDPSERSIAIEVGKTHASRRKVLLPPLAWSIVHAALEQLSIPSLDARLFPAPHGGEIPENEVSRAARKIVDAVEMVPWTPRDLRRTATSRLTDLGVDGDVRRRITGHVANDVHGRVYDRAQRLQDGFAALEMLESFVLTQAKHAATGQGNVVNIRNAVKNQVT
jgi:integrase